MRFQSGEQKKVLLALEDGNVESGDEEEPPDDSGDKVSSAGEDSDWVKIRNRVSHLWTSIPARPAQRPYTQMK